MKTLVVLLFGLISLSLDANVLQDDAFFQIAQHTAFMCELSSSYQAEAKEITGRYDAKAAHDTLDCVNNGNTQIADAYKQIPESKTVLKGDAKKVYSAWLNYGEALGHGLSDADAHASMEGVAFRAALDEYRTDLELN